jgi:hypothetical protein
MSRVYGVALNRQRNNDQGSDPMTLANGDLAVAAAS